MGWEDRDYSREGTSGTGNPLMWILTGSIPLFTAFGIRVRAHSSLVIFIVLVLLFGLGRGFTWQDRVQSMTALFVIVLLHEFGHCFAARWVGGDARDILMHPLGGLARTSPPRRPMAHFIVAAGGPAVNVLICLVCGAVVWATSGRLPWMPFRAESFAEYDGIFNVYRYALWIYQISWVLLLFNLMPIYPLDGGQLLQAILWPKFGFYKSMLFSCITGMIGAVVGGVIALASFNISLVVLAYCGFMTCYQMRLQLLAAGPYGFQDEVDYSASLYADKPNKRASSTRSLKKRLKQEQRDAIEQTKIDTILAKVSAQGMHKLTWLEKRTLRKATERQQRSEASRGRKAF